MHNYIPINTVGFIAVMLLIGTSLAWRYVVPILVYTINSGEYCKEKSIFIAVAITFTSKKLSCQFYCLDND